MDEIMKTVGTVGPCLFMSENGHTCRNLGHNSADWDYKYIFLCPRHYEIVKFYSYNSYLLSEYKIPTQKHCVGNIRSNNQFIKHDSNKYGLCPSFIFIDVLYDYLNPNDVIHTYCLKCYKRDHDIEPSADTIRKYTYRRDVIMKELHYEQIIREQQKQQIYEHYEHREHQPNTRMRMCDD